MIYTSIYSGTDQYKNKEEKQMGWAKYDEDNREIMEERWNNCCNRRPTYPNSYSCATTTKASVYQPNNSYKSASYSINARKI